MEPRTKAFFKGLIWMIGTFILLYFIPYFVYSLSSDILRDSFILYNLAGNFAPEYQAYLIPPIYPIINIDFNAVFLFALPVALVAFFVGFFKGDTVGHALGGLTRQLLIGLWFLASFGAIGFISLLMQMKIPLYAPTLTEPYYIITYIQYLAPIFLDYQALITLGAAVIFFTAIIYLAELGIGISNRDYWRYWGK